MKIETLEKKYFGDVPTRERTTFQRILMALMSDGQNNDAYMKWMKKYVGTLPSDRNRVAEIIDNENNVEIRNDIMEDRNEEAAKVVKDMLEKGLVEVA